MKLDMEYATLQNGLRLVLHKDASLPLVCINIAYGVGSKDEPDGLTGFAHLFEHLMFSGSKNVPHGLFDRYCEEAGGHNNAFTNEDKTNYYMMLPSHQLALGLWLESDRLLALDISHENLEVQRKVVLEEKRQRVDNQPYGSYDTKVPALLFPGHPYGHPVIGSTEDITQADMDSVRKFHGAYYVPNNAVLAIGGDIDYAEARMLAERYFGDIARSAEPARQPAERIGAIGELREYVMDDVPLPAVFLSYRMSEEQHKDFAALDVVTEVLSSGESSRLYRALVYERQCASDVVAYVEPRFHQGGLLIAAFATPGNSCDDLERAIDEEIEGLVSKPMTDGELTKNQNRIETSYHLQLQTLSARCERLAHYALFRNDPHHIETLLDAYGGLTPEDVRIAAGRYLQKDNRVVLHYLPRN
jgi:zinc protease